MSITTYAELLSEVEDIIDRDDLDARFSTFVQLAEARLNRILEDPEMEVTSTIVAAGTSTALPSDFGGMVSISTGNGQLLATGPVEFASYDHSITGTPRRYTIVDGAISFAPANSTASITIVYRRRIPPLTATDDTNWLLELAPDAYLYAVLAAAHAWDHDEERATMYDGMVDRVIGELRQDAARRKWGAGPIAPRIGRP